MSSSLEDIYMHKQKLHSRHYWLSIIQGLLWRKICFGLFNLQLKISVRLILHKVFQRFIKFIVFIYLFTVAKKFYIALDKESLLKPTKNEKIIYLHESVNIMLFLY